jgi:methylated-DNA-protein-cysteine methyltransferase-like protein
MNKQSSDFFQKVYDIVAQVPAGCVITYGQIAVMAGNPRCARIVGYAMYGAPPGRNLPCHRVVNRKGTLSPRFVFGGQECQRRLLEQEGVTFTEKGCIDMKKHLWWT